MDPQPDAGILAEVHDAVRAGDAGALDALATLHGPDAVVAQCRAVNALILAAESNHIPVLQWLADHGAATLDDCCADEGEVFHVAAVAGFTDVLDWLEARLVASGQDFTAYYHDELSLAGDAAEHDRLCVLEWLAARGLVTRATLYYLPWYFTSGGLESLRWFEEHYKYLGLSPASFIGDLVSDGSIVVACAYDDRADVLDWILQRCALGGYAGPFALAHGFHDTKTACESLEISLNKGHLSVTEWLSSHGFVNRDVCMRVLKKVLSPEGLDWLVQNYLSRSDFVAAGCKKLWQRWWLPRLAVLALVGRRHAKLPQDQRCRLPPELFPCITAQA
jgi:hypothetical protein